MPGTYVWSPTLLEVETDMGNAFPGVRDVSGGPPAIHEFLPEGTVAEERRIGNAEHYVPAAFNEGVCHLLGAHGIHGTPVIFQVVYAPVGPLGGVILYEGMSEETPDPLRSLEFQGIRLVHIPRDPVEIIADSGLDPLVGAVGIVSAAAYMSGISDGPGGRIYSEFQSFGVDIAALTYVHP